MFVVIALILVLLWYWYGGVDRILIWRSHVVAE